MPRRYSLPDQPSVMVVQDNKSDETLHIYYVDPTPQQRINYRNGCMKKKGRGKVEDMTVQQQQKFGQIILVGWGDGEFEDFVGGKWVPVSSNSAEPNHRDKAWFAKHHMDLVELLAFFAFERTAVAIDQEEDDTAPDGAGGGGEGSEDPS